MSAAVAVSASAVLTTAMTVIATALPEARDVLSPILENSHEYAIVSGSLLMSIPVLIIMTLLAASVRD